MEYTENIKTTLKQLSNRYPGYLFEIEEYPTMMMVWVRSKRSGIENRKAIEKCHYISLANYEIEKMVNEIKEEELKSVVGWSNKNLITNKYTITPKKLIFQDEKATIINWSDGTKTVVKCTDGDTFSPEAGVALCYMKKFIANNDTEGFHRLLKGLISVSKFNNSKQEDKSSLFDCVDVIKGAISKLYTEENHDNNTGAPDNTGNNDPDNTSLEVES